MNTLLKEIQKLPELKQIKIAEAIYDGVYAKKTSIKKSVQTKFEKARAEAKKSKPMKVKDFLKLVRTW